jgi:hypothetical protein
MFIGHYGVAFAARRVEKRIPLWMFFIAVQLVDILWCLFVFLGIEKVRIVHGYTAGNPLDFYYFPYTHSLIGGLGWAGVAFVLYRLYQHYRGSPRAALILGAAVLSHWFLDVIVHARDLDIINENFKVGMGLWNYPLVELLLELVILFGGLAYYLIGNAAVSQQRKLAIIAFAAFMGALQVLNTFGPAPTSVVLIAISGLVFYLLLTLAAYFVEPRQIMRSSPDPGVQ